MITYNVTVSRHETPKSTTEGSSDTEVLKCSIESFDLLTFVQALTATKRGRPAKSAKKESASQ